jgi:hypothetical protein
LDRSLDLHLLRAQALEERVEPLAADLKREMDVRAAAAAGEPHLRRPDAEPRGLPDQVPATVVASLSVARLLEPKRLAVEAARRIEGRRPRAPARRCRRPAAGRARSAPYGTLGRWRERYKSILAIRDARQPVIGAVIDRVPIAGMSLAMILLVRLETGSFAIAGVVEAAFAIATAISLPIQGASSTGWVKHRSCQPRSCSIRSPSSG